MAGEIFKKGSEDEHVREKSWVDTYNFMSTMVKDFPEYLPNTYLKYYLYPRHVVDHSKNLYSYEDVTTNRIEACWTHFKRMILGAYRNVHTKKYLQRII